MYNIDIQYYGKARVKSIDNDVQIIKWNTPVEYCSTYRPLAISWLFFQH